MYVIYLFYTEYGCLPVAISYIINPNDHRSDAYE